MADHLDVERGRPRPRRQPRAAAARPPVPRTRDPSRRDVVDVTAHPEINDLVLAADVAVLDYSSLRFDFALTGKPMVFLVPDLADYHGGTRSFLFPFEESAPGPFVDDTPPRSWRTLRDVAALRAGLGRTGWPTSTPATTPGRTATPPSGSSTACWTPSTCPTPTPSTWHVAPCPLSLSPYARGPA